MKSIMLAEVILKSAEYVTDTTQDPYDLMPLLKAFGVVAHISDARELLVATSVTAAYANGSTDPEDYGVDIGEFEGQPHRAVTRAMEWAYENSATHRVALAVQLAEAAE